MSALLIQNSDGASFQAQAVLAMVRCLISDGIDESWSYHLGDYVAEPRVSRWENLREKGYIIWMKSDDRKSQINIGFWEGRSSDDLDVLIFDSAPTLNAPTVSTLPKSVFEDGEPTVSFRFGQIENVAQRVVDELRSFWVRTAADESDEERDAREKYMREKDEAEREFFTSIHGI